jgi:ubiquinone/menaquinone biosynthesis C-methylase UbiE
MAYINEYTELGPKEKRQLSYKRKFKEEHPEWDDSMVLLTKLVEQYAATGSTVLDLGCGNGNFVVQELPAKFSKKIGIDIGPHETRNNRWLDEIVYGNIEQLPFPNQTFDVVLSLWVLEHLEHPDHVFKEISRVLKPGGIFAFVTPNRNSFLIFLRRLMPSKLASRLVDQIYGRTEDDTFDVFYRANTVKDVSRLAHLHSFITKTLTTNADPSYTSFNPWTYRLSSFFAKYPGFQPHLVGIFQKPSPPPSS